jgi:hypothetical protein
MTCQLHERLLSSREVEQETAEKLLDVKISGDGAPIVKHFSEVRATAMFAIVGESPRIAGRARSLDGAPVSDPAVGE